MSARNEAEWRAAPGLPRDHWVPGSVYTEPEIFALERREIFARTWRFACHESELPKPGDYRCLEHAGLELFLFRGPDGLVRCFFNACSHRGARLLSAPSGNARKITCFYHLWTYDARGRCIGIPRAEGYSGVGVGKAQLGLREVRCENHLGLLFINLDDEAPPLEEYLDGALSPFDSILRSGSLEVFHFSRTVLECNWKAWHETNMDLYHEYMHVVLRQTQVNAMPMKDRALQVYGNGHGGSGRLKAAYDGYRGFRGRDSDEVPPLPGTGAAEFLFSILFSGSAVLSRGTVMRIDTVTPQGPDRTVLEMRGLGIREEPPEHRRIRERHHNQYWGPFGRNVPEDMLAAESCARSFAAATASHQLIARDEALTGQDDAILRNFYREWRRRTGVEWTSDAGVRP